MECVRAIPRRRAALRPTKQPLAPVAALGQVAPRCPEPCQRCTNAQSAVGVGRTQAPLDRGPQVVVVVLEALQPVGLIRAGELGTRLLRELSVMLVMSAARLRFVAALAKLLLRVLAHRLRKAVAGLCFGRVPADQALVGE